MPISVLETVGLSWKEVEEKYVEDGQLLLPGVLGSSTSFARPSRSCRPTSRRTSGRARGCPRVICRTSGGGCFGTGGGDWRCCCGRLRNLKRSYDMNDDQERPIRMLIVYAGQRAASTSPSCPPPSPRSGWKPLSMSSGSMPRQCSSSAAGRAPRTTLRRLTSRLWTLADLLPPPVSRADRVPLPEQGTGTDSLKKRKNSWPPVAIAFAVII